LQQAGAHILAIKDMAGLCQPRAAFTLVKALKDEIGLPVHFHTHDTSGIAAASVLAAVDAGADAVDGAIDAMSGLTSQPNLGSIVEALRHGPRDTGIDPSQLRSNLFSMEWPPKSGQKREFPEADRAGWFRIDAARTKIHPGQAPLLDELLARLDAAPPADR